MNETNFGWAVATLRAGYAVRRTSWPIQLGGHYVYLVMHETTDYDLLMDLGDERIDLVDGASVTTLTEVLMDWVMSYDWEIYDVPQ